MEIQVNIYAPGAKDNLADIGDEGSGRGPARCGSFAPEFRGLSPYAQKSSTNN